MQSLKDVQNDSSNYFIQIEASSVSYSYTVQTVWVKQPQANTFVEYSSICKSFNMCIPKSRKLNEMNFVGPQLYQMYRRMEI